MPYSDAIGTILRITGAVQAPGSQIQECDFNFVCTVATGTLDTRSDLLGSVATIWGAYCTATLNQIFTNYGTKASVIYPLPPPAPELNVVSTVGVLMGGPLPTQARPLISWQTANAGRKYRGRNYLPTPDNSLHNPATDAPAAGLLTAMDTFGVAMVNTFSYTIGAKTTTWDLCVAHRSKTLPRVYTFDLVTGHISRRVYATQWKSGGTGRINTIPF